MSKKDKKNEHEELFFHDHYECSCGFKTEIQIEFEKHSKNTKMKRFSITPEWIERILSSNFLIVN